MQKVADPKCRCNNLQKPFATLCKKWLQKTNRPHWATVCKICGKIGDLHFFETEKCEFGYRSLDSDEVFERYKDLENIIIDDIWQKYVPVSWEGGE